MAWNSVKRNAWRLVKWAFGLVIGTIGFLEIAPRYEQWKATVWSLISGVPPPSTENAFWNVISLVLLIVGVIIILSDILPRVRSKPASQEVRPPEIVPVTPSAEKLKALSPIHVMIMAIERVSPREASFGPGAGNGIGRFVRYDTPNLNWDKVRSVFSEYAHVLGDHHLKEWLKFSEEIREYVDKDGFWVGKREWKWFDELETEYQDAVNASLPQTTPEIAVKLPTPQPELTIAPTDLKEHEKIKEIQLVLRDGEVIRHEARLYYITVTNTGRRSLRVSARLNFDQHMIFVPLNKKPMFRVESKYDTEGFEREVKTFGDEEAIAIALMSDKRWESRHDVTIYPGPTSEAFVLFFTLKDFRVITVPGGTRIYPNYDVGFPCKLLLGVCLVGDDLSPYCDVATFEVTAKNWKDFKVTQIGKTVRQSVS